mmetsp:Transcript_14370/g.38232  ORF Transcript_14370/g.38232 Transcript_14370/m.38232 type:complete len:347 (+) Transcript_14370:50-1090(+)
MHEPLYRFHLSPCAALAVEAFRSLQQFLSNAAALYLIHSSCEDELKRCKRTLRSTLKKLQARNAPGNSSGSSGCSNQETLAVDIIDLTTDDNEGQDRKRRRQDPDDDDDEEEEEEDEEEAEEPSRSSNPLPNGVDNEDAEEEEDMAQGHTLAEEEHGHGVHESQRGQLPRHQASHSQQEAVQGSQQGMKPQQRILLPVVPAGNRHGQQAPRSQQGMRSQQAVPENQQGMQPQQQTLYQLSAAPAVLTGSSHSRPAPGSQQGMQSQSRRKQTRPSRHLLTVAGCAPGMPEEDEERARYTTGMGKSDGVATPSGKTPPHQGSPAAPIRVPFFHRSAANLPAVPQPPLW